ncbi:MAG: Grx4 family monothiol glutaredoxin [Alphaproteobacteria bacterium]|nr:Grx4 family monothiol glutaredoxin [Alphaproteobacteria bacterium]MCB1551392.1 Grx4 family monothiol glutaredoxin [Alphaproteobacteria bacterium]MCB9984283.1 Grx4 family monothiol glutaredoxin [Micavibrio sp.]HPQ50580.1 Grx4 family monothiol glutaredoxin [Alphaproteobacteria bacterium]HRK97127.1 Grx4 family monothiol glutaredoxin [Alphaproteobacteria bacterium]
MNQAVDQSKVFEVIKKEISSNDIVLFMKGTKVFPQCGFSALVANILNDLGLDFVSVNVLEDDDIRQGIKDFSNWPTIPQLYIKGEFIGGCDIVKELYESGELQETLEAKGIVFKAAS